MKLWSLARRADRMNPSIIREILKITDRPGILSMAGGLPSPDTFPIQVVSDATRKVLQRAPREALQYSASEGFTPLREWVAQDLARLGMQVDPAQVLITTGSQQGLDLAAKVLLDAGSEVLVETPTYLGAIQAFSPYEPEVVQLPSTSEDCLIQALSQREVKARFLYLVPSFQNPTGRCLSNAARDRIVKEAQRLSMPIVEDNPYGDLWFDEPPPAPLAARFPEGVLYLGSFSKILAPGLRIGYAVAPSDLYPKLLQAKQAADLHTPGFVQRVVHEVVRNGFLDEHIGSIRARYAAQRNAMATALRNHMPEGCSWEAPPGGMFFWVNLPPSVDAVDLLPKAVSHGIAFVPGSAFYAENPAPNTIRLSFVTLTVQQIDDAIKILGSLVATA